MQLNGLESARAGAALQRIRAAAERCGVSAYVVGGTVRDALLGRGLGDADVAVEGELEPLLDELGAAGVRHERFGTAKVELEGGAVDLARCRREHYPAPGALPEVEPGPIRTDLARRDFTLNAMAVPLGGPPELIDPYDGAADLDRGLLRVIHDRSFVDDPTRALRAARYSARLGLALEPHTEELLRAADLGTVSADRVEAELGRIAAEEAAVEALSLLVEWGLLGLGGPALELAAELDRIASQAPWSEEEGLREAALRTLVRELSIPPEVRELAAIVPARPSEGAALASRQARRPELLLLARAAGAEWLDCWLAEWRHARLAIGGDDLLAHGVEAGPRLGQALRETLERLLDGELSEDRDEQLEAALAIARRDDPGAG